MAPPSVLAIDRFLLVTFPPEMDDADTETLPVAIGAKVVESMARGVVMDLSGLPVIDSHTGRTIAALVQATGLLGVPAVVAGMRPEVAITLVELGMMLPGVPTARTVDLALAALRARIGPLP